MNDFVGAHAAQNQEFWPVRNDSGEEIPAYACLRITGTFTPFDEVVSNFIAIQGVANYGFTVAKPNTWGAQFMHCFNGPMTIGVGKVGQATFGRIMLAKQLTSEPTLTTPGSHLGPVKDEWFLSSSSGGFINLNGSTENTVLINGQRVMQSPMIFTRGTAKVSGGTSCYVGGGTTHSIDTSTYGSFISAGDAVELHWERNVWYAKKI
jgi:hypothetical protein